MITRRLFLVGSVVAGSVAVMTGAGALKASEQAFRGIIYTKNNPGRWKGKAESHAPQVSVVGRKVTITTPHPMSGGHYIVRHTLVLTDGSVAGEKTFFPEKDTKAFSIFELPEGYSYPFFATSFCNLHDLWVSEGLVS